MRKNKLYDLILKLLKNNAELRDSDKKLMWEVWRVEGAIIGSSISQEAFLRASSCESIRRCRQKIQELNSDLKSTKRIREFKLTKQEEKGTFIYRETLFEMPKVPTYYQD